MEYKIIRDWHTHTVYSRLGLYFHGKGTIMQNVRAAHEQGLEEVAITDHGPRGVYGLNPGKLPQMRKDIAEAQAKYPDVRVLLGVEANIVDSDNGIDIEPEHINDYDFINAGYHYVIPGAHAAANLIAFKFWAPDFVKEKLRTFNTRIVLKALYSNDIKVLTHPGDKAYVDLDAVARACEETGTLMELNARHRHMNVEEIRRVAKYGVDFIIGSDAHKPKDVGRYAKTLGLALAAGVEIWRIINVRER